MLSGVQWNGIVVLSYSLLRCGNVTMVTDLLSVFYIYSLTPSVSGMLASTVVNVCLGPSIISLGQSVTRTPSQLVIRL
jgi:hypothetical protein